MALKDFLTALTIRDATLIIAEAWEEVSNKYRLASPVPTVNACLECGITIPSMHACINRAWL